MPLTSHPSGVNYFIHPTQGPARYTGGISAIGLQKKLDRGYQQISEAEFISKRKQLGFTEKSYWGDTTSTPLEYTAGEKEALASDKPEGLVGATPKYKPLKTATGEEYYAPGAPQFKSSESGIKPVPASQQTMRDWVAGKIETGEIPAGEKLTTTPAPEIPEPTAGTVVEDYTTSLAADAEKKRTALDAERKRQLEAVKTEKDEIQKKIDEFTAKQEGVLEEAKPLTDPFRADLEKTERDRLKVEENYFENQKLVEELDTLLSDVQSQVQAEKDRTGLASIRNPRIQKAGEEAAARVGVIEAVMASRNNQITVANNLIDRSVQAITADRTDQLNYYNTLLDFYQGSKDDEGAKLFQLTQQETKLINDNISLLESDLASAQANADYIKGLMLDPSTAGIVANSGVTLNDTPEQVRDKFANFEYSQEVSGQVSEMSASGYQVLSTPETIASKDPAYLVRLTDSKGVERVYYSGEAEKDRIADTITRKGDIEGEVGGVVETEDGTTYDLTTVAGISAALADNYPAAEIKSYLDLNTKLTASAIDDLIKAAMPEEVEQTAEEFVTDLMNKGMSRKDIEDAYVIGEGEDEISKSVLDSVYGKEEGLGTKALKVLKFPSKVGEVVGAPFRKAADLLITYNPFK